MVLLGAQAAAYSAANILPYKAEIQQEARNISVRASIVAGICSRETAGLPKYVLPPPKGQLGDNGHACGIMQVDDRSFPYFCAQWKAGKLKVSDSIHFGCQILLGKIKAINRLIPSLLADKSIHAAIAAYNCGEGNVRHAVNMKLDLDYFTKGRNYGSDVLARASYFASIGYDG